MASERFPGLDKRHGFFLAIENNQTDRDSYHWKTLGDKEKKKQEIENQVKSQRRQNKRSRQKPDRQVYQPPHLRHTLPPCYRIEIEVAPNTYWIHEVSELGKGSELASDAALRYNLDNSLKEVIEELLNEFEIKLTIEKRL